MDNKKSLEELEGTWPEPEFPSGLVLRCHTARKKSIDKLSDLELATLLDQGIGIRHILPEAIRRLHAARRDDTELFDGQLQAAVNRRVQSQHRTAGGQDTREDQQP